MDNIRLGRLYQLDALHSPPYSALTHTPLSYLLDYAVYSRFPALWALRLVNIVLSLGCALLVANLSRVENGGRRIEHWFAAGLFLMCTPVFFWSQVARCPDALACLFSLLALTALVDLSPSLRRELLVGGCWALAVLSKQTAAVILAPVLFGYDMFLTRNRSRMYWRFLFCGAILLPAFLYLQWSTHGGFFQNVVGGNLVRTTAGWWKMVVSRLGGLWMLCIVVALLGGLRKSATCLWFVTSLAFGLPAVAKRGADIMYFFDTSAALAVLAAAVVIRLPHMRRPALAGVLLAVGILALSWDDRRWRVRSDPDDSYRSMTTWLSGKIGSRGQVLSDDAGIPLAFGQHPVWDDPFIFAEWAQLGAWRENSVEADIRSGRYTAIVVGARDLLWSPAARREIAGRYRLVKVFPSVAPVPRCIYVPVTGPESGLETLKLPTQDALTLPCYIAAR